MGTIPSCISGAFEDKEMHIGALKPSSLSVLFFLFFFLDRGCVGVLSGCASFSRAVNSTYSKRTRRTLSLFGGCIEVCFFFSFGGVGGVGLCFGV